MPRIDAVVESRIVKAYERDNPRTDEPHFTSWVDSVVEEVGCEPKDVRNAVARHSTAYKSIYSAQIKTSAQRLADIHGATLAEAFSTLADGLKASEIKALVDDKGRQVKGDDGRPMVVEKADWATRRDCAKTLIEVHGGYAPKQIQMESHSYTATLDVNELLKEFAANAAELERLTGVRTSAIGPAAATDPSRIEGKKGGDGLLVLADGVYEDGGRAGPVITVEAIPEPSVLPVAVPRVGSRKRKPAVESKNDDGKLGGSSLR